jgi:hypothetical protein
VATSVVATSAGPRNHRFNAVISAQWQASDFADRLNDVAIIAFAICSKGICKRTAAGTCSSVP